MIVLLSRAKSPVIDPALAAAGNVRPVRTPRPPRASTPRAIAPLWADRQLVAVDDLVATGEVRVFVSDAATAAPFAWRVAERYPTIPVLAGQALAARVLALLAERQTIPTTDSVRDLLDDQRLPWPDAPRYLVERSERPPLIVSLVNNTVDVDSRVQKVARSLGDLGYDSVLLGRSPRSEPDGDWFALGSAVVLRPPVTTERLFAQRADPPAGRTDVILGAPGPAGSAPGGRLARRIEAYRRKRQERNRESFGWSASDNRIYRDQARAVAEGRLPASQAYPAVLDWADAFVPLLTMLRPDAIHVHDPTLIPAAVRARSALSKVGRSVALVYDAHEWTLGIARDHALQVPALAQLESSHMADMAAVVTVSQPIADLMTDHFDLARPPTVVTNSPVARPVDDNEPDVRKDLGLTADVPLLVYTGSVAEARGLELAFRALRRIPAAHLVMLSRNLKPTRQVLKKARELGVGERVHRLDYVPADDVPAYLRSADVGLIPFQPHLNSDLGLPTKYREYLLAGLPIVATDLGITGADVVATGVGEVAPPDDAKKFAAAIAAVLANPQRYRSRITDELRSTNSWQQQEQLLAQVYESVLGRPVSGTSPAAARLVIGGLNSAGQATAWARALSARGVPARSLELRTPENPFQYDADIVIPRRSAESLDRRLQVLLRELMPADAVIIESGQAIAAPEPGSPGGRRLGYREARALAAAGRNVGLIFHGSDLRRPDVHARTHQWSPFSFPAFSEVTDELRKRSRWNHEQLASWDGPVMVSTPDLLRQNPGAEWVPVVVDVDRFAVPDRAAPDGPPIVLHLPSKSMMKGSHFIDPVLQDLAAEGIIRYRRATSVPHDRVVTLLAESDIFVDQMGMGILGVAAVEAMASGIPVVTDPGPEARAAYGTELPVVRATPDTLGDGIRQLVADRERWATLAAAGPEFARAFHDGTRSAGAIISAMGIVRRDTV